MRLMHHRSISDLFSSMLCFLQLLLIEAELPVEHSGQIPPYCAVERGRSTTIFLDAGQGMYLKSIELFGRLPNEYYRAKIKAIQAAYAVGAFCPALARTRKPPSVSKSGTYVAGIEIAGNALWDLAAVTEVILAGPGRRETPSLMAGAGTRSSETDLGGPNNMTTRVIRIPDMHKSFCALVACSNFSCSSFHAHDARAQDGLRGIVRAACAAAAALHDAGLVHRDIRLGALKILCEGEVEAFELEDKAQLLSPKQSCDQPNLPPL